MQGMFCDAKFFNQKVCWDTNGKDTSYWLDQSKGTTYGCPLADHNIYEVVIKWLELDLKGLEKDKITRECSPMSEWNVSRVTIIDHLFHYYVYKGVKFNEDTSK